MEQQDVVSIGRMPKRGSHAGAPFFFAFTRNMKPDFAPILLHNFLEKSLHDALVRDTDVFLLRAPGTAFKDEKHARRVVNGLSTFDKLHEDLNPWLESTLKRKTKPSYSFLVEYKEKGFFPKHVDRSPCKYTLTLCLKQSHVCPLWVDGAFYEMQENSLLLYSGTDHLHERPMLEKGFTRLVLLHYVDSDYQGPLS